MSDLLDRLRQRVKEERQIAENSEAVARLLQNEVRHFEAGEPYNLYVVRMALDHRNSAQKDEAFANDLEEAIRLIEAARQSNAPSNDRFQTHGTLQKGEQTWPKA